MQHQMIKNRINHFSINIRKTHNKDAGYSVYYDYLNHKGYKSKQYSRGNVLMPGRFLTTTSDAFVSYVTAYDFIHQPEGCIDVDRPLWRDLRERTMEDDNPILLLYYVRK